MRWMKCGPLYFSSLRHSAISFNSHFSRYLFCETPILMSRPRVFVSSMIVFSKTRLVVNYSFDQMQFSQNPSFFSANSHKLTNQDPRQKAIVYVVVTRNNNNGTAKVDNNGYTHGVCLVFKRSKQYLWGKELVIRMGVLKEMEGQQEAQKILKSLKNHFGKAFTNLWEKG